MQIIQSIRDKGAAVVIVVIALSLIGFILMDAQSGGSKLFGSSSADLGKVDGNTIELSEFNKKVQQLENQEEQRSGMKATAARSAQIREQVWNQLIAERVFYAEADKLGIDFTAKELSAILSSNDADNPFMQDQQMVDPATGQLDMTKVKTALGEIKKAKGDRRDIIEAQVVEPQKLASVSQKYVAMLNASAYYPTWMQDKDTRENREYTSFSYVAVPFASITDSTIKVTDADIEKYVSAHKSLFKQEEGRMISYVAFSQLPNADDSLRTKEMVSNLKSSFEADANPRAFIARNTSVIDFDSNFIPKSKINSSALDTIIKFPVGTVYGPYNDKGSYVLAKLLGSKSMPDSMRARHILVPTIDPQTNQAVMEDSTAKKKADSILAVIKAGADFAAMAKQYGSDGTRDKGGDLGFFGYDAPMVPEFNQFGFSHPVGTLDILRTRFGYHVIELTAAKGAVPAYKIAFLAKEILASDATINNASLEATKLAAQKEPAKFEEYRKKQGLEKIAVPTLIKENDASVGQQLPDARQLVRWVFDAKKGEISDPYSIGDQFIVAIVDKVFKEGTQDVETARPMAEAAVRDEKKAEMIIKKLGNNPTPESAAAAYGVQVQTAGADSSISFNSQVINGIGPEPKLIGAGFNKDFQAKASGPIIGKSGVYIIKVISIGNKGVESPEMATQQRAAQLNALRNQASGNWFEPLRKKAKIKDNRSKFY